MKPLSNLTWVLILFPSRKGWVDLMKLSAATLLLCLALFHVNAAQAEGNWLTLVGDPKDQAADYIQLNPSGLSRDKNRRIVPVRVSRVHARTSKEGIVFRSFEGVAAIDCVSGSARILQASFYAEANFKGKPIRVEVFKPDDVRPLAFREVSGQPTQRVVRAACNTRVASN
ncbi:MAG: hypothetical protein Q7T78_19345 [Rhodoferax sp.]|nr:hypothetical protein [Rhodoferax sp.]